MASLLAPTIGSALGLGTTAAGVFAAEAIATVAISAGTSLAVQALTPKQNFQNQGARLSGAKVTSSSEGSTIPHIYGTFQCSGNIIWATRFKETINTTTESVGGKGGGGQTVTTTEYNYSVSLALGLCQGEVDRLVDVYFDGQKVDLDKYSYTFYTGSQDQMPDPTIEGTEGSGNVPAYRGLCYIVFDNLPLKDFGNRIPQVNCVVARLGEGQLQSLQSVVEDLCNLEGINPEDLDAEDLGGIVVDGYYTEGLSTPREALEELSAIYFFDMYDDAGVLTFRRRSSAAVHTVFLDDVVASASDPTGFEISTRQEEDLPSEVVLSFVDATKDYSVGTVTSEKIGSKAENSTSLGGLVVLSESSAKNRANVSLKESYNARDTLRFALPLNKYNHIQCSDYIDMDIKGYTFRLKVVTKETSDYLTIEASSVSVGLVGFGGIDLYNDQDIAGGPPIVELDRTPTPSDVIFLDLPLLATSTKDDFAPWLSVYQSPWFGGVNFFREDGSGGHTLTTQATLPCAQGVTTTDLSKGITDVWDMKNSVTVMLDNPADNLASVADVTVLNGANSFAVLTPSGEWEVFQAANVELNPDGSYTLSRLLRGRLGTEYYMGEPTPSGSTFVVVEPSRWSQLPTPQDGIGIQQNLRYGPVGFSIDDDVYTNESYTPRGVAFRPYSPVKLNHVVQSNESITFSWVRRDRFSADGWNQAEIPMSEDSEKYVVEIIGDDGSVLREITTNTTSATYESGAKFLDILLGGDPVGWRVYQVSSVFGKGTPAFGDNYG